MPTSMPTRKRVDIQTLGDHPHRVWVGDLSSGQRETEEARGTVVAAGRLHQNSSKIGFQFERA